MLQGVTKIKGNAFAGFGGSSITIPDGVTSIGQYAFSGCTAEIKWGDNPSIKEIGNAAFSEYRGTNITIPDSVTSIGSCAFLNNYYPNTSLESITIPDSVTSIGRSAFYNCTAEIKWGDNPSIKEIVDYGFENYKGTSITIPDSVTSIGYDAFKGCKSLTSINFGDKSQLASIGNYAFYGCTSLTSITIPDSVTSIDSWAFYACNSLKSVTIGNGVTSIGWGAFGSTNLNTVKFKNPTGWYRTEDSSATSGTDISSSSLQNSQTAAKYLKDTYKYYYWKRKS